MGDTCSINPAILLKILISMGRMIVNIAYLVYQITSTTNKVNLTYNKVGGCPPQPRGITVDLVEATGVRGPVTKRRREPFATKSLPLARYSLP